MTFALTSPSAALTTPALTPIEQLGKALFFDNNLSKGGGMMCGGMSFPAPEVNENLAVLKHFRCSDQSYIVTFLKTLSDGYFQR